MSGPVEVESVAFSCPAWTQTHAKREREKEFMKKTDQSTRALALASARLLLSLWQVTRISLDDRQTEEDECMLDQGPKRSAGLSVEEKVESESACDDGANKEENPSK